MSAFKFRIGQKVVCIGLPADLLAVVLKWRCNYPVANGIYTIRGRDYFPADVLGGQPYNGNGYLLEEVVNDNNFFSFTHRDCREGHFNEEFFRPLVTSTISAQMEALLKLQDPANHQRLDHVRELDPTDARKRKKEKAA